MDEKPRNRGVLITLVGICLIFESLSLSGCQRKKKRPTETKRTIVIKTGQPKPPIRILREEVISHGDIPQILLRYKKTSQSSKRIVQRASATLTDTVDGVRTQPTILPTILTGFDVEWKSGKDFMIVVAGTPAQILTETTTNAKAIAIAELNLRRYRGHLANRQVEIEISPRGELGFAHAVHAVHAINDRRVADNEREFLSALVDAVVVLPKTPVGVGARWKLIRAIPKGLNTAKQTVNYELTRMDGNRLWLKVTLETIGERQPIDIAELPIGATAELFAMKALSRGTVIVELDQLLPIQASYQRNDAIHIRVSQGELILRDHFSESQSNIELSAK